MGETCPRIRQVSWPIDVPIIVDAALLHNIQVRVCSSGDVNIFQWNRVWFFSRRVEFDSRFNVMAVYEVSWHGPEVIDPLHRHPDVSLEVVKVETLLILQENFFDLLLELGGPTSRWIFSVPALLQQIWLFHLRLGIWIFHFLWEILLPLHWVF